MGNVDVSIKLNVAKLKLEWHGRPKKNYKNDPIIKLRPDHGVELRCNNNFPSRLYFLFWIDNVWNLKWGVDVGVPMWIECLPNLHKRTNET